MSLLATRDELQARAQVVSASLPTLLESMSSELHDVMRRELRSPEEKAKLTRKGGRCSDDGALLEFDPFSPDEHLCPRCGRTFSDEDHYRWWLMSYQLFLAERAVHGALLHSFTGDVRFAEFSESLLAGFAQMYPNYPNSDNALGPSRPFFSTYLESIWLLQICVALDLLEVSERGTTIGSSLRKDLIEPSSTLIASYDEGGSNRQAWNSAALLASARLLRDDSGFARHATRAELMLQQSLLPDGTWYEGENYHLFAHRGLWYIVEICASAGHRLSIDSLQRYRRGFSSPFRTALPDMTLLARRDSQHGVALRQWRFAELCELGIAGNAAAVYDDNLIYVLHDLYSPDVPAGDTGRNRSTAEVERNLPPVRLSRADLGWKSLLRALPAIPELPATVASWRQSTLLESQGIAVFQRESGRVMVSLDYGHHGGGHGHPDRLNLNFHEGTARWLDDPGTGSYVDSSLFWYRSSLAHNAPMTAWRTQSREHGMLHGYEQLAGRTSGWMEAGFDDTAGGVAFNRTLVVLDGYFVDQLSWKADTPQPIQLPLHVAPDSVELYVGASIANAGSVSAGSKATGLSAIKFETMPPDQPSGEDRGLAFVSDRFCCHIERRSQLKVRSHFGDQTLTSWIALPEGARLWRMRGPGPPNEATREFVVLDFDAVSEGRCTLVHDWSDCVAAVSQDGDSLTVLQRSGVSHSHRRYPSGWQVLSSSASEEPLGFSRRWAGGTVHAPTDPFVRAVTSDAAPLVVPVSAGPLALGAVFSDSAALALELGENHYRRSELDWLAHRKPTASVRIIADADSLLVGVRVRKDPLHFAEARREPYLDNEHPDVNSDGIQFHLVLPGGTSANAADAAFLLVPQGSSLRVVARAPRWKSALRESGWKLLNAGYSVALRIGRDSLPDNGAGVFFADVIVNLLADNRERRSGQLVMSGAAGEWTYLMGDRQSPETLLPFRIADE